MDAEQDIKWAIRWNRFNLHLVGIWPDPLASNTGIGKYRFLLAAFLMITFMLGPQSANLVLIWGDVDLMTENLATGNISVFNAVMKLCFVWYHRNTLKPLLRSFNDDWHREKMADERSTMLKTALIARKISIGLNVLTQSTLTMYLSLQMFEIVTTENRTSVEPMQCAVYLSTFPYDNRKSPMFEFTCLGQIITSYTLTITYTGVDSFICMLILHTCGQYANLGKSLRRLFDKSAGMKYQKDISKELKAIIKRHNHLNRSCKTIEESFNVLLLIQMLGCTIQLCFQGFQIIKTLMEKGEMPTLKVVFLVLYIAFVALHFYIYCYVGEMLLTQSSAMGYFAYESLWYDARPCESRDLLLIMHRSTKPLCLTAGKFSTFCLETFSTIMKTSMGYLSVLVAVSATAE